jgi:hypothetical protein
MVRQPALEHALIQNELRSVHGLDLDPADIYTPW